MLEVAILDLLKEGTEEGERQTGLTKRKPRLATFVFVQLPVHPPLYFERSQSTKSESCSEHLLKIHIGQRTWTCSKEKEENKKKGTTKRKPRLAALWLFNYLFIRLFSLRGAVVPKRAPWQYSFLRATKDGLAVAGSLKHQV